MATITTETLQQSAPLLCITIQSLCASPDLDIFQFHFNSSHYLWTFSWLQQTSLTCSTGHWQMENWLSSLHIYITISNLASTSNTQVCNYN